jgi:hypothetical protein
MKTTIPNDSVPPLPPSRVGLVTRRKIDGSPLVYRVEVDEFFVALSNPKKAFYLQKLRFDDGDGFDKGHDEYRISYYMVAHKPRTKGKWQFAQYAPFMTREELKLVLQKMQSKRWGTSLEPPRPTNRGEGLGRGLRIDKAEVAKLKELNSSVNGARPPLVGSAWPGAMGENPFSRVSRRLRLKCPGGSENAIPRCEFGEHSRIRGDPFVRQRKPYGKVTTR